jgi:hypothetical protein
LVEINRLERLEGRKNRMTGGVIKSKRVALSWDQEFKPALDDLRSYLNRRAEKKAISNSELFMLCLGVGFEEGHKNKVPARISDAIRLEAFKDSNLLGIMQSVALADSKDYNILMDEDAVFDIVEAYAAGGLETLSIQMQTQLDFLGWLTALLYKQAQKFQVE